MFNIIIIFILYKLEDEELKTQIFMIVNAFWETQIFRREIGIFINLINIAHSLCTLQKKR